MSGQRKGLASTSATSSLQDGTVSELLEPAKTQFPLLKGGC